jgi:hypothetical protein
VEGWAAPSTAGACTDGCSLGSRVNGSERTTTTTQAMATVGSRPLPHTHGNGRYWLQASRKWRATIGYNLSQLARRIGNLNPIHMILIPVTGAGPVASDDALVGAAALEQSQGATAAGKRQVVLKVAARGVGDSALRLDHGAVCRPWQRRVQG